VNIDYFKTHDIPEKLFCKSCNQEASHYHLKQCGPHLGAFCGDCQCKIKHLSKKKNTTKREKVDLSKYRKEKYDRGYAFCAICYRSASNIKAKTGLELEVHHIREVQHKGTEDAENLICVCVDCHSLIHSIRNITWRNADTWRQ
jgi:hypothetical protein